MKDFLIYLLGQMTDVPDTIKVDESVDEYGQVVLAVTVAPEEMGKFIGKGGKVIRAIRELVKVLAVKENKKVQVVLTEQTG